jgi:FkbM family methyltransferase
MCQVKIASMVPASRPCAKNASVVARYLFPAGQIHAFEPLEQERRRFETAVSGPVRLYNIAVHSERGNKKFYVTSRADSSSLLKPRDEQAAVWGVCCAVLKVDTARLDVSALPRPALLKMDTHIYTG